MESLAGVGWPIWLLLVFFVIVPAAKWGARSGTHVGLIWAKHWRDGIEGGESGKRQRKRLRSLEAELERRDEIIADLSSRIAELENRADFTERLLASSRSSARPEQAPDVRQLTPR